MAGKKRKLKKALKRKLMKDIKKKDNKDKKAVESKVEKQVIDNQTLQQIMMAQMMNSRDRLRRGEDVSWTTVQNQNNADRIQAQQKINALKAASKEWEMKAKNIKENEQYKEIEEKLKQEVEDKKKYVEQAQKIIPLQEQLRELEAQKAELEQKFNDPLNQIQMEKTNLENYIKHLKETVDSKDPEYKEMSNKIAEYKATLKKLKEREQLIETRNQLNTELENKRSEMKAAFKQLRAKYPKELGGVQWNAKDINEIIQNLIDKEVTEIAENETTLKKYQDQQQINEEYTKVAGEFKRKEAEMKADMEYIRQQIPDFLKGVAWNATDRDEKILEAKHKAAIERDNMNKQLEIMKETSEEMKIVNQVKADRDIYEKNFMKEHPSFYPIFEEKLRAYGENITPANRTKAFGEAFEEYEGVLADNYNAMVEANEKLHKSKSYEIEAELENSDNTSWKSIDTNIGNILQSDSDYVDLEESDNSDFDKKKG